MTTMELNRSEFIESLKHEFTIKTCHQPLLLSNFKLLFPNELKSLITLNGDKNIGCIDNNDESKSPLYLIIVWSQTVLPMSGFSAAVDEERELRSNLFIDTATKVCNNINNKGYWADFIDPLSGVPHLNRENANSVFVPTESVQLMDIDIVDVGCCQVMVHPIWKVKAFFSLIVSTAPFNIISEAITSSPSS